jgi:hypothetical protein
MVEQLAPQGRSQLSPNLLPHRHLSAIDSSVPHVIQPTYHESSLSLLQCACLKRWSSFPEFLNKAWAVGGLQIVSCSYYYYKPAYHKYELLNFSKTPLASSPQCLTLLSNLVRYVFIRLHTLRWGMLSCFRLFAV